MGDFNAQIGQKKAFDIRQRGYVHYTSSFINDIGHEGIENASQNNVYGGNMNNCFLS